MDPTDPPRGADWTPTHRYLPRFRFASTRFDDDEEIPVWVEVTFKLGRRDQSQTTLKVKSATFTFKAHNKGLALATKQFYDIRQKVYTTQENPLPGYYDWGSQIAVRGSGPADPTTAGSRLKAMNHTVISPNDGIMLKGDVIPKLGAMTAFFAYTHGETACFLANCGNSPGNPNSTGVLDYTGGAGSEVGQAVWTTDRTSGRVPRPNLIVMHACSGIKAAQSIGQALGILRPGQLFDEYGNQVREGRAYRGFPDVVDTALSVDNDPDTSTAPHHLQDHAKLIYRLLFEGKTIERAVFEANRLYKPTGVRLDSQGQIVTYPMDMLHKVDPYSRLIGVYTGGHTPAYGSAGKLVWHLVLPPLTQASSTPRSPR